MIAQRWGESPSSTDFSETPSLREVFPREAILPRASSLLTKDGWLREEGGSPIIPYE